MIRLLRTRVVARALVGLAVVALVATSCDYKPSDETAISVNGHVTTMAAYSKLLSGMEAGKKCIESLGVSPKISFDGQSYNAGAVRFAANLVVQNAAIDNVLAANSLFVTAEQKSVAATSMSTNCP